MTVDIIAGIVLCVLVYILIGVLIINLIRSCDFVIIVILLWPIIGLSLLLAHMRKEFKNFVCYLKEKWR